MKRGEAEKVAFHMSLLHFALLTMQEAVLRNSFLKQLNSLRKLLMNQNSYSGEAKLCQTEMKKRRTIHRFNLTAIMAVPGCSW